ncbi:hypothetical protein KIN20_038127 [Parelaphostrongylus tenuis]|uniref:PH domain-containing protein n=1 Tax=Parelaphostrongylus tenuis TaxID=148309 RepID=A0AAD5REV3_PARTN|nr:hypothetical protein KIN20_038127 [Parelaphostrongylus tenuis]
MLANAKSLYRLAIDPNFERRFAANLQLQQDFRWRPCFAVLKANLLFVFNKQDDPEPPFLILIIEDCFVELCDENKLGRDFTFEIKYKSTGRSFVFAAEDFKALERWVSLLTITPIDYMLLCKQSFAEQIERCEKLEQEQTASESSQAKD